MQAAVEQKESQRRNSHIVRAYNHLLLEQHLNDRPRFYCKKPSITSGEILEGSFENEDSFSVLKEVQPAVANASEWQRVKKRIF